MRSRYNFKFSTPEARNGSNPSKAKTKKVKNTEQSSKHSSASNDGKLGGNGLEPVPIFREYPFSIDEFACLTCPKRKITVMSKAGLDKQEQNQHTLCGAFLWKTDKSQAAYCCKKGCKLPNGDRVIICNNCYFNFAASTGPAIACMLKDFANMELPAISGVISHDDEIKVPMSLRSAMAEILKIHNCHNLPDRHQTS